MVRQILDAVSVFRDADFTAIVTEMGIKLFGENETPKAYIEFDDGGVPLTYFLTTKDKSVIEPSDNGHAKVKNFKGKIGVFVEQATKFGYKTYVDIDPDNFEFGTTPDLVGMETTWKVEKGGKYIGTDGTEKEGYNNFTLVGIKKPGATTQTNGQVKDKAISSKPNEPALKPGELDPVLIKAWKDKLSIILKDQETLVATPKNAGEIQKAINDMIKTANPEQKIILNKLSGIRPAAFRLLESDAEKFMIKDADLKYRLAEEVA